MFTNVAGKLCLNKPSHKDNQQEDKYFRWKSNIDFGLKNYEIIRIRNCTSEPKKKRSNWSKLVTLNSTETGKLCMTI